jgi:hypothetical protein
MEHVVLDSSLHRCFCTADVFNCASLLSRIRFWLLTPKAHAGAETAVSNDRRYVDQPIKVVTVNVKTPICDVSQPQLFSNRTCHEPSHP